MTDALGQMNELLRCERQILLCGEYDKLEDIAVDMARCLAVLAGHTPDRRALSQLKEEMARNQHLINAALGGIASATQRVAALQSVRDALKTYDPSGNIDTVATPRSSFEKKA